MTAAICYETPTRFARYTVADGVGITKGRILKVVSPNRASACTVGSAVGGIAWMEKVASDGSTEIVAALDGTWGIYGSTGAGITCGVDVRYAFDNKVSPYTTLDDEKGNVLGKALETIATSGALIKVRVNV